ADRDSSPRHPEAGLLLPVAPRQPPVRSRSWRGRARLYRCLLEGRPGLDRAGAHRARPRRLRTRLAEGPRRRLGYRSDPPSHARRRSFVMSRLRQLATASLIAIAPLHTPMPATEQWIVFDPNNYAQNVLTAARELQQINIQIASLQNQAQML